MGRWKDAEALFGESAGNKPRDLTKGVYLTLLLRMIGKLSRGCDGRR
jgi:hypothetical protein